MGGIDWEAFSGMSNSVLWVCVWEEGREGACVCVCELVGH